MVSHIQTGKHKPQTVRIGKSSCTSKVCDTRHKAIHRNKAKMGGKEDYEGIEKMCFPLSQLIKPSSNLVITVWGRNFPIYKNTHVPFKYWLCKYIQYMPLFIHDFSRMHPLQKARHMHVERSRQGNVGNRDKEIWLVFSIMSLTVHETKIY